MISIKFIDIFLYNRYLFRCSSVTFANECKNPATRDNNRTNSVAHFFGNLIPPKVEIIHGAGVGLNLPYSNKKFPSNGKKEIIYFVNK